MKLVLRREENVFSHQMCYITGGGGSISEKGVIDIIFERSLR